MPLARRSLLAASTLAGAGIMPGGNAWTQSLQPSRTIRILIGFEAGGGADAMGHSVGARLERRLGMHIAVERRTGSFGAIPGEIVKKGPADGSQLAILSSTTLVSRLMTQDFPFDPVVDLAPTALAGTFSIALAVSPSLGIKTFDEYLQWLKAGDASRRRIAVSSNTAFVEVLNILIGRAIGQKLQTVAYRGAVPIMNDLRDGVVPATVNTITSILPGHRGGRARILMHTGSKRLAVAPDIPTAVELGYPKLDMEEWFAFFLSGRTPPAIVAAWNDKLRAAIEAPEVVAELRPLGLNIETSTPEELVERVKAHRLEWEQRLKEAGLAVN